MTSAGARAYNGGLGAETPAGSKGRARGSDAVLAPRHPQEGQNRPICMLRAASANCRLSCATA